MPKHGMSQNCASPTRLAAWQGSIVWSRRRNRDEVKNFPQKIHDCAVTC
jgi:hypothetical protein